MTIPEDVFFIARTPRAVFDHVQSMKAQERRVALVPTMGALHDGHLALIDHARQNADYVVVSIFVNPTQFGEGEDFNVYPRTWESDLEKLGARQVETIYAPTREAVYPSGFATTVSLTGPAEGLETQFRPHFFSGVATVVAKLLLSVMPDCALFGEKDYQQLQVIKQMTRDLHIPVDIIGVPTIREKDGLALSSRNAYLSAHERAKASIIYEALGACAGEMKDGLSVQEAQVKAHSMLKDAGFDVDYLRVCHAETLRPLTEYKRGGTRILCAARLGTTRLIDNIGA